MNFDSLNLDLDLETPASGTFDLAGAMERGEDPDNPSETPEPQKDDKTDSDKTDSDKTDSDKTDSDKTDSDNGFTHLTNSRPNAPKMNIKRDASRPVPSDRVNNARAAVDAVLDKYGLTSQIPGRVSVKYFRKTYYQLTYEQLEQMPDLLEQEYGSKQTPEIKEQREKEEKADKESKERKKHIEPPTKKRVSKETGGAHVPKGIYTPHGESFRDWYESGLGFEYNLFAFIRNSLLKGFGIRLEPEMGKFGGYNVYYLTENVPGFDDGLRGLDAPSDFRRWVKLKPNQRNVDFLRNRILQINYTAIDGWKDFMSNEGKRTYLSAKVRDIIAGLCYPSAQSQGFVNRLAYATYDPEAPRFSDKASLAGKGDTVKFIPPMKWFPDRLKDVSAEDLMSIFPEDERKSLMLALGRICTGKRGEEVAEMSGKLNHTFRSISLIVGLHPGLGKSWLFNDAVNPALQAMGYTVSSLTHDLSRFSFSKASTADILWVDDLTREQQNKLLSSSALKTIASGGALEVEEKFKPSYTVSARSTVIACSNSFSHWDMLEVDSGVKSRLNVVSTVTDREATSPDKRCMTLWHQLAEEKKVSITVLAQYLLRLCTDYFLNTIGYVMKGSSYELAHKDRLQSEFESLRANFRIDIGESHVDELVKVTYAAYRALFKHNPEYTRKQETFSASLLGRVMPVVLYWNTLEECPEPLKLNTVNACESLYAYQHESRRGHVDSANDDDKFRMLTNCLRTHQGFKFPKSMAAYMHVWDMCVTDQSIIDATVDGSWFDNHEIEEVETIESLRSADFKKFARRR